MKNINREKLNEILDLIDSYYECCYLGGSRTLPFITNPHDYDIFVVCPTEEDKQKAMKLFRSTYDNSKLRADYDFDIHFITEAVHLSKRENCFTYTYLWLTQEAIKNKTNLDLIKKNVQDILDDESNIINLYKEKISLENPEEINYKHKRWYYIYITLCILKNKSFDFTEEQIHNINVLHDRDEDCLQERMCLIDDLIEEVQEWQI